MAVKCFTIYTQRLAGYLMTRGFTLINIGKAKDGSGRNVFFFRDSEELRNAVAGYRR